MPSTSKSQQRFFGLVHAIQKGEAKGVGGHAAEVARKISPQDATDFASTKQKGLPEHTKKKEAVMEKFTADDIKMAAVIARKVAMKKKAAFPPYDLDAPSPYFKPTLNYYNPNPRTWGQHLDRVLPGLGEQAGTAGRMMFTGHGGHNSMLGNVLGYPFELATHGIGDTVNNVWDAGKSLATGSSYTPNWENTAHTARMLFNTKAPQNPLQWADRVVRPWTNFNSKLVSEPWRLARPGFQKAFEDTGAPGRFIGEKYVSPALRGLGRFFTQSRAGY